MNKRLLQTLFFLLALILGFICCENDTKNEDRDTLYVKFENDSTSEFTITGIQLLVMGEAGELEEPVGEFDENILPAGTRIAPNGHTFFTANIPNLYYAYYRLTIDDGNGNQINICEPTEDQSCYVGTITHWGSDERTVYITIKRNPITGLVWITNRGERNGIDY